MILVVTAIRRLAQDIIALELRSKDGQVLPLAGPGSHIRVTIPGLTGANPTRAYSIVSDPADRTRYEIAVLRVYPSGGGSASIHQLRVGDALEVSGPRNEFSLNRDATHSILIAGGIGITPILSLTRELSCAVRSYELHYIARDWERLVYRDEISALAGPRASFYVSAPELALRSILVPQAHSTHVYLCGPYGLIETVRSHALAAGFPPASIHYESFGYRRDPKHRVVEIELRNSGLTLTAEPGQSLLEAIEASGVWVPSDCRRGDCAACITTLVEGEADHRDHCLTQEQRTQLICPCVSWARTDWLVLDI